MKRATIAMTDDLKAAVAAFQRDQEVPPTLTAIAQTALREYLMKRGYLITRRPLRITPATYGSGSHDVSTNHDRYLC